MLTSTAATSNEIEVGVAYDRELNCKMIIKNERASTVLGNSFVVTKFILDKYSIDYIPSIKTDGHAMEIINSLLLLIKCMKWNNDKNLKMLYL